MSIIEEIAERLGLRAERGKRFADLTSLRVGGAIDWVITPDTEEQAAALVYELDKADIGWRPLGGVRGNLLRPVGAACDFNNLTRPRRSVRAREATTGRRASARGGVRAAGRDEPRRLGWSTRSRGRYERKPYRSPERGQD